MQGGIRAGRDKPSRAPLRSRRAITSLMRPFAGAIALQRGSAARPWNACSTRGIALLCRATQPYERQTHTSYRHRWRRHRRLDGRGRLCEVPRWPGDSDPADRGPAYRPGRRRRGDDSADHGLHPAARHCRGRAGSGGEGHLQARHRLSRLDPAGALLFPSVRPDGAGNREHSLPGLLAQDVPRRRGAPRSRTIRSRPWRRPKVGLRARSTRRTRR